MGDLISLRPNIEDIRGRTQQFTHGLIWIGDVCQERVFGGAWIDRTGLTPHGREACNSDFPKSAGRTSITDLSLVKDLISNFGTEASACQPRLDFSSITGFEYFEIAITVFPMMSWQLGSEEPPCKQRKQELPTWMQKVHVQSKGEEAQREMCPSSFNEVQPSSICDKGERVVVFDTETTGTERRFCGIKNDTSTIRIIIIAYERCSLDKGFTSSDEIIEIGAVEVIGQFITGIMFNQFIKPTTSIHPRASSVHGLEEHSLRDAPSAGLVLKHFLRFVGVWGTKVPPNIPMQLKHRNRHRV
eukprot:gene18012-biopygen609